MHGQCTHCIFPCAAPIGSVLLVLGLLVGLLALLQRTPQAPATAADRALHRLRGWLLRKLGASAAVEEKQKVVLAGPGPGPDTTIVCTDGGPAGAGVRGVR